MTMSTSQEDRANTDRSATAPTYYEGLVDHKRGAAPSIFHVPDSAGLITGTVTTIMFTIDRPVGVVWGYFRDLNLWQNSFHHYYSGVAGDLEGQKIRLTIRRVEPDATPTSAEYLVTRVIPEHLLILSQIKVDHGPVAGMGGLTVFTLHEINGKTTVTIMMQHDRASRSFEVNEALALWRDGASENLLKWRDFFIPTLKNLVNGYSAPDSATDSRRFVS